MRGAFADQGGLFLYISPEARVPPEHPLRKIRALVRDVLGEMNRDLGKLYASEGRPSMRKTKHRGLGRVAANFLLNLIAYNLIRIPKLVAA
jgi:hypothetical protein